MLRPCAASGRKNGCGHFIPVTGISLFHKIDSTGQAPFAGTITLDLGFPQIISENSGNAGASGYRYKEEPLLPEKRIQTGEGKTVVDRPTSFYSARNRITACGRSGSKNISSFRSIHDAIAKTPDFQERSAPPVRLRRNG